MRSGRLTRPRVDQIIRWVERMPHDLKAVAKACNIYPADLMAWYLYGQDPECKDTICVELAWRIATIRAEVKAKNYERIVAAADGGTKTKVVERTGTDGDVTTETHTEDVLPAAWAIEKLDKLADASAWEIAPDNEQAAEIQNVFRACEPTPLLPSGEGDDAASVDRARDGETEGVHPGPEGADQLPGGAPARED